MTPLGLNQSGRRKDNRPIVWEVTCLISIGVRHHFVHVTSLDQSEGGIDITWPWVLGMGKRTFTHKFDREKKIIFLINNSRVEPGDKRDVCDVRVTSRPFLQI